MGDINKIKFQAGNEYYSTSQFFAGSKPMISYKILESGRIEVKVLNHSKESDYAIYDQNLEIECLDFTQISMGVDKYYTCYSTLAYSLGKEEGGRKMDKFLRKLSIVSIEKVESHTFHLILRTKENLEWIKMV